ncbi:MAG: TonB family protein [Rubrivivax sp.]|nr:TonB family protein [Pyrinomonadaceae bacterium]
MFFLIALPLLACSSSYGDFVGAASSPILQGDAQKTIEQLLQSVTGEGKKDPDAWFQLGVEYARAGDTDKARKAFRQAFKLRPDFRAARAGVAYTFLIEKKYAEAEKEAKLAVSILNVRKPGDFSAHHVLTAVWLQQYRESSARRLAQAEQEIAKNSGDARWHLLKAEALLGLSIPEQTLTPDFLLTAPRSDNLGDKASAKAAREADREVWRGAAASLEKFFALNKSSESYPFLRAQLETLRFYLQDTDDAPIGSRIFLQPEVTTKAVIRHKPSPGFTAEARGADVSGMVRLRGVLVADGTVKHLLVIKPLGHGLTESALQAARAIKFTPATVNGQPVSQSIVLEYNFNIY